MKLKTVLILLSIAALASARVLEKKTAKPTNKSPIVLRQDVEEYNDSENAVDGNTSESNAVDEADASEIVNCYEVNCNEATNTNADEEPNSENNEVIQEINQVPQEAVSVAPVVNVDDTNPINRYCKCTTYECNCCRDFALPLVPVKGPGCATIQYLEGNRMSVGIKFGDRVVANRVISGRKATPVCLPLPGGFNRFCGRVYGINRRADDHFKACLGLELRADNEIEAVLRVSCFKFGPRGLAVTEPEPLPPVDDIDVDEGDDDEDDEDDDADDLLGSIGLTDDDDDDDEDDDDDDEGGEEEEPEAQPAEPGYTGFSLLEGDFLGDLLGTANQKKKKASVNKDGIQSLSKDALEKKPTKQTAELVEPEALKKNVTITKTKKKQEDSSDEITDIVASLVTGGDDESAENDDDDEDEDDDSKEETKDVTEEPAEEDDYDESEENETNNDDEKLDTKQPKKPSGFNWSNFTRLFRII